MEGAGQAGPPLSTHHTPRLCRDGLPETSHGYRCGLGAAADSRFWTIASALLAKLSVGIFPPFFFAVSLAIRLAASRVMGVLFPLRMNLS